MNFFFRKIIKRFKHYLEFGLFSIGLVSVFGICLPACKNLIEVDSPINQIVGKEIYNTNTTAASVITGIYSDMSNSGIFTGQSSISVRTGLSADEFVPTTEPNNILNILYLNTLTNNGDQLFWTDLYAYIFRINGAIEGVSASLGISTSVKQRLLGEAKFLRAFMYFYLTNLYGNVPILISTNIKINGIAFLAEKTKVYEQIVQDLKDAQNELDDNYLAADIVSTTAERVRPNKATATALLARVYLYNQQWQLSEVEATKLIANTGIYKLEELNNTFISTSKEAIWQLQPIGTYNTNTLDALTFILAEGNGNVGGPNSDQYSRPIYLSKQIFNSFEAGDNRKEIWVDSVISGNTTYPYAYKYKVWLPNEPRVEYLMVMRLGEQYLIRAEARAEQGRITGVNSAEEDLNTIRNRAGLSDTNANTLSAMLDAILKERKVELFSEWGHRWFDLKRTNKIDEVMTTIVAPSKGSSWSSYKSLYPIPIQDIQRNPSLRGHQNLGYPEL